MICKCSSVSLFSVGDSFLLLVASSHLVHLAFHPYTARLTLLSVMVTVTTLRGVPAVGDGSDKGGAGLVWQYPLELGG